MAHPVPPLAAVPVEIVAEIGTGHRGNRNRARELIAAAADSGADLVKFQHFYADEIIHPKTGGVKLPGGELDLYSRFRELETGPSFIEFCKDECLMRGVGFFCSPFGIRSASELIALGETRLKIASPELNHHPLLTWLAEREEITSLVLSTGVSTLGDIEETLGLIGGIKSLDITLLHCITAYPSPEEEFNIRLIGNLSSIFGLPSGLSDHSLDPVLVPALAVLAGAVMVEKHFTISREDGGLDDPIALDTGDFARMSAAIRQAESLRTEAGHGSEINNARGPRESELRRGISRHSDLSSYPEARINAILGSGVKTLAPSEAANYGRSNRSIHALNFIPAGSPISKDMICVVRSEKNLRPGLHPRHLSLILGRRALRDIPTGEGLLWDDLLT